MADQVPVDPASPIVSNVPGSFPWAVWHERHPVLIEQVKNAHPYPPRLRRALDRLLAETLQGTITALPDDAPDRADWAGTGARYFGLRWTDAPFLWAESYFYRRLLHAVEHDRPGAWRGVDPFAPVKSAELGDPALADELAALDLLAGLPEPEQRAALLHASLWGNRADLGFALTAGTQRPDAELVADDSAAMWSLLDTGRPGTVCLVADNAGRELLPDLMLIDHLLGAGLAARVALHIKPEPYYVSDATVSDVLACLDRLVRAPGAAGAAGLRLHRALREERLVLRTDGFYTSPRTYRELPPELVAEFAAASLTIVKGDLNYRRLVGDLTWPATTPFAACCAAFPGPVAALRTLKSDVVVGLAAATVARLDATGRRWRTSGTHALIQTRP